MPAFPSMTNGLFEGNAHLGAAPLPVQKGRTPPNGARRIGRPRHRHGVQEAFRSDASPWDVVPWSDKESRVTGWRKLVGSRVLYRGEVTRLVHADSFRIVLETEIGVPRRIVVAEHDWPSVTVCDYQATRVSKTGTPTAT
jgi:hypothetical protein